MFETTAPLRRGARLSLIAILAVVLAACTGNGDGGGTDGGGDGGGGGTATVSNGTVEITADDLAFSADTIEAPAGEAFTIAFENLDSAQHNISVYVEEGGEVIAMGDVIGEGETNEVEVSALEPGEYFFVCDVHPNEMTGTLVVEEASAS